MEYESKFVNILLYFYFENDVFFFLWIFGPFRNFSSSATPHRAAVN